MVSRRKWQRVRACLAPRSPQKGQVETPKRDGWPEAGAAGAGKDGPKGWELGVQRSPPPRRRAMRLCRWGQGSRQSPHLHGCLGPVRPPRPLAPPPPIPAPPPRAPPPAQGAAPAAQTRHPRTYHPWAAPVRDHFRFCPQGDSNLSAERGNYLTAAPPPPGAARRRPARAGARDSNPGPKAAASRPSPAPGGRGAQRPVWVGGDPRERSTVGPGAAPTHGPTSQCGSRATFPPALGAPWELFLPGGSDVSRPWRCTTGGRPGNGGTQSAQQKGELTCI